MQNSIEESTTDLVTSLAVDSTKKLPQKSPDVVPFTNKSPETAIASSPTDKTVQALPVSAGKQEVQAVEVTNQTAEITDRTKLQVVATISSPQVVATTKSTPVLAMTTSTQAMAII